MKRYTLLTALLAATSIVSAIPGPYSQRYSDDVMDQRLCLSMMTGLDYISYSLSAIIWQYADFYNNPQDYPQQRNSSQRYEEVFSKTSKHDITLIRPAETYRGPISIVGDAQNFDLVLEYPLKFKKGISGYVDFGLRIKVRQNYDEKQDKNVWHVSLGHANKTKLTEWKCFGDDQSCNVIKDFLENDLVHEALPFLHETVWNQPTAFRQLSGLINYINEFSSNEFNTLHLMTLKDDAVALFFNCKKDSVEEVLAGNVKRDYLEVSLAQNILDQLGIPHEIKLDLDELKEEIKQIPADAKKLIPAGVELYFTKDPKTLAQIDYSKFQSTIIKNTTAHTAAKRAPHPLMDKIEIQTNLYIQVKQGDSDLSIIPITAKYDFLALLRAGPKYIYGDTQELKAQFIDFQIDVQDCQTISKEHQSESSLKSAKKIIGGRSAQVAKKQDDDEDDFDDSDDDNEDEDEKLQKKAEKSDDDEEDFEEDDEEDDGQKKEAAAPKLKPSNAGLLICSMRDTLKKKYLPEVREKIIDRLSWRDVEMTVGFLASINEYYPTNEKWLSLHLLCSGMDTKDQKWNIIGNRVVISYELNKDQMKRGSFCESENWIKKNDPRTYTFPPTFNSKVQREGGELNYIKSFDKFDPVLIGPHLGKLLDDFQKSHFWVGRLLQSHMTHYFGSYTHFKEFCQQKYPEIPEGSTTSFYDNCALSLVLHKNNKDVVEHLKFTEENEIPAPVYKDLSNVEFSKAVKLAHDGSCYIMLFMALASYYGGISLDKDCMLMIMFLINMQMGICELFNIKWRYGVDYVAYIQQAGAVYMGERDYTLLSSHLGPCYYPAGHIWHYIPAYWLHLQTHHAENIIKLGHQVIHTLCIMVVYLISHLYFRVNIDQKEVPKAQLIGFILLTNPWDRTFYTYMYNDQIMTLYILFCMYFTLANKPMLATFFFTLGLSVKAGVLLLLPAFLGQMQYNYGTVNLIKSIALILAFQVLVAAPFIAPLGETSVADYLVKSKLTGAGRNGFAGALPHWDYLAAHVELTVFWSWVDPGCYFDKECFADRVKMCIVLLNVYHFFIRKWCTIQCFKNLFQTFNTDKVYGIHDQKSIQKTTEILVIGYFCGIVFMPGANIQFQFWFLPLVPLLIEMVGLPSIFTFFIYQMFYPVFGARYEPTQPVHPEFQHYFLLGTCCWLITIGPCPEGLYTWISSTCSRLCAKKPKVEEVKKDKKNK